MFIVLTLKLFLFTGLNAGWAAESVDGQEKPPSVQQKYDECVDLLSEIAGLESADDALISAMQYLQVVSISHRRREELNDIKKRWVEAKEQTGARDRSFRMTRELWTRIQFYSPLLGLEQWMFVSEAIVRMEQRMGDVSEDTPLESLGIAPRSKTPGGKKLALFAVRLPDIPLEILESFAEDSNKDDVRSRYIEAAVSKFIEELEK